MVGAMVPQAERNEKNVSPCVETFQLFPPYRPSITGKTVSNSAAGTEYSVEPSREEEKGLHGRHHGEQPDVTLHAHTYALYVCSLYSVPHSL